MANLTNQIVLHVLHHKVVLDAGLDLRDEADRPLVGNAQLLARFFGRVFLPDQQKVFVDTSDEK